MPIFKNKLKSDEKGSVAVELIPVAGFLLFMFVSLYNVFDWVIAWLKATKANYAVADMFSRQTDVDLNFIRALDGVHDSVSQTRAPDQSWFVLALVYKNSDGDLEIESQYNTYSGDGSVEPLEIADIAKHIPSSFPTNDRLLFLQSYSKYIPAFAPASESVEFFFGQPLTITNQIVSPVRFASTLAVDTGGDGLTGDDNNLDSDTLDDETNDVPDDTDPDN